MEEESGRGTAKNIGEKGRIVRLNTDRRYLLVWISSLSPDIIETSFGNLAIELTAGGVDVEKDRGSISELNQLMYVRIQLS